MTLAVVEPAMAQSNASGTVFGKVAPGSGDTVVLKSNDTNATRTATVDANGSFRVTSLPIGTYSVTLSKGGNTVGTTQVDVIAGQGAEAFFANAAVQTVQVTGRRTRIDVSSSVNGSTFTARELDKLPIGRNVDAIIQLAPNTTRGDPSYPAGASIAGGAASENAFFINGMTVTNPLTGMGSMELPFGAIAQASVLTGGYGVEFGRSLGGVVNITTKSGTNTWEAGAYASIVPKSTRSKYRDRYYANTGAFPDTDGTLYIRRSQNESEQKQVSAYVGGPLIKDTLFGFISLEQTKTETGQVAGTTSATNLASSGWLDTQSKSKRYYGKLDWNISDNHRLEFTTIGDLPSSDQQTRSYNYATGAVGSTVTTATHQEFGPSQPNGGKFNSLRYIGNITEDLTINGLYGKMKSEHIYTPNGYDPTLAQVSAAAANRYPGFNYTSGQKVSGTVPLSGASDEVESKRLDLEYKLGAHTIRGGFDNNKITTKDAGVGYAGGSLWQYQKSTTLDSPLVVSGGTLPQPLNTYGGIAAQGYYVRNIIYQTYSNAYAGQDAQYLEDRWQVTKDVLVTAGIRREGFYNANQDGAKYIEMKNQWLPRLNVAWDVNGDSSLKVYGSAGRYTVPIPSSVALRGANGSKYTYDYFTYTGTDANGLPTGTNHILGPVSSNNEFGQAKDPKTVAAQNMKPAYQDEITLGMDKQLTPDYTFGMLFTYRKLRSTIDDICDSRPFDAYAAAHNIDTSNYAGFGCATFNPGEDNDFLVDFAGNKNYTNVHLTKADLGFDKPTRTFAALDFSLEHPYRNGWWARVTYTLQHSRGNTEGQTLSDTSTAQTDIAATQTWDYPEQMIGADGPLPNERKHQIKAFGFYDITPEWGIGGNVLLASGRPRSCFGTDPLGRGPNYGGAAHYCFGETAETNVLSPRGSLGTLPWEKTVDLNLTYKPKFLQGLQLRVDVYNVFNSQTVAKVDEVYNGDTERLATYEMPIAFSAPRSMKFSAEYNYKFK